MNNAKERTRKMKSTTDMKDEVMFKTTQNVLKVFIVVAVMESLSLLVLSGYWRHLRDSLMTPRQQRNCFHWDKFVTLEDEEEEKHCPKGLEDKFEEKTNSTNCCGTLGDVLDGFLTKALKEKYDSDTNPELPSLDLTEYNCKVTKKPQSIARLVDLATNKKPVPVGLSSKLFWNSEAPSYTKSGFRYLPEDGSIYVQESGQYFVSLQLKTKLDTTSTASDDSQEAFRHYVHLVSKGTGTVILEDAQTTCDALSEGSETTSVLGALFKLQHGDRLYVATSHPQNIVSDPHSNFFSLHGV